MAALHMPPYLYSKPLTGRTTGFAQTLGHVTSCPLSRRFLTRSTAVHAIKGTVNAASDRRATLRISDADATASSEFIQLVPTRS